MAFNTSHKDIVLMRRERVASLRARGLTVREIAAALNMVNPTTGEPFDAATIHGDIKANQKAYLERANLDTAAMVADQLAEIAEVKRAAWGMKRLDLVLRGLEREAKLQGLDAPTRIDLTLMTQVQQIEELAKGAGVDTSELFNELIRELVGAQSGPPGAEAAGR